MGHSHKDQNQEQGHGHTAEEAYREYTKVLMILFGLTGLTVVTSRIDLGAFAGLVAFAIAAVKAYLVMSIFMHLKDDKAENRWIFASGFFFLLVLFFFSALDIWTRIAQLNTLG